MKVEVFDIMKFSKGEQDVTALRNYYTGGHYWTYYTDYMNGRKCGCTTYYSQFVTKYLIQSVLIEVGKGNTRYY